MFFDLLFTSIFPSHFSLWIASLFPADILLRFPSFYPLSVRFISMPVYSPVNVQRSPEGLTLNCNVSTFQFTEVIVPGEY
jgi:hypothetical protein